MKYMTLTAEQDSLGQSMGLRAGHPMRWSLLDDAGSGIQFPVFDLGPIKVAMIYAFGAEPVAGQELLGMERLICVGDIAFVALMPESEFNTSAYLRWADLDESLDDYSFNKAPPITRATVINTMQGEKYHAVSVAFVMPEFLDVRQSPKTTAMELTMWTRKVAMYFYGYMAPALMGTPTMEAVQLYHEAFINYACMYHSKHGGDFQMVSAGVSFQDMIKSLTTLS